MYERDGSPPTEADCDSDYYTIEKTGQPVDSTGDSAYVVYGHSTYPESSVNAGYPKRQYLAEFDTEGEAKEHFPSAEVSGCTREASAFTLPDCPPEGFDPHFAGETW